MRNARQVIGLLGLFGQGNLGNDGSLEAMINFLRRVRPEADLVCICSNPAVVERIYGLRTLPINWSRPKNAVVRAIDRIFLRLPSRFFQLFQKFRQARMIDVIIVPGTGILDDFGEGPLGMPAILFVWCLAAKVWGTRFAFVSIGAGPIHHPVSRWLFKRAAAMAHYRSYRDQLSKEFMESIGFETEKDLVFPDIAFALPAAQGTDPRRDGPLKVGVGIMIYYGWRGDPVRGAQTRQKYIGQITRFVLWLLDRDYRVRLLMGDAEDKQAIEEVLRSISSCVQTKDQSRVAFDEAQSLQDVMNQISETDVIVATRFHNIVCSLKMARPTISISYAKKNDVLMAEMGMGELCQNIEQLDVDRLFCQFDKLIAQRGMLADRIRTTSDAFQASLRQQDEMLLSKVL